MAYIHKIIAKDETLHGIARLHWIYVVKGIAWFVVMAGSGWLLNLMMGRAMMAMASSIDSVVLPQAIMTITNGAMFFLMAGGFFIFFLYVLKILVTEIGLSDRRIMHKTGLIFVKVQQVDLEEIRGENMDLGTFGRLLGYGYIMLDCRFIGDVKLPAIESPERFIRGLHALRASTQDSLSVVLGKGDKKPLNVLPAIEGQGGPQGGPPPQKPTPEIEPGKPAPQPEVDPGNIPAQPEIQPEPTPHNPPPSVPPSQPVTPQPQPTQPIPAPAPSEPPLQPPTGQKNFSAEDVAQIVKQVLPQMAQEVVKELVEEGMIQKPQEPADNGVDNDLAAVFDDASHIKKMGGKGDDHDRLEHVIH